MLNRRSFVGLAAAALAHARAPKTIGVQLYTVRGVIGEKPLEVLKAIEQIGFKEVEATWGDLDKLWDSLKQTSLRPVSLHLDTQMFSKQQDKLQEGIDKAKSKGFAYVVCPYVAPADRGGPDVMKKLADTLNKAGEMSKKAGMQLCYHNHAFEFEPSGNSTLLDILMDAADPKLVGLELDIMWSQVGGVDPVALLKKYGKRVMLMHLKNVSNEVPKQYNEKVPKSAFKEVGAGVIEVPRVLDAAAKAGVKHYFVEQDQTPGDPIASLKESYQYLQTVK